MATTWNGKGEPPSRAAAIAWLAKTLGVSTAQADAQYSLIRENSDASSGSVARATATAVKDGQPLVPIKKQGAKREDPKWGSDPSEGWGHKGQRPATEWDGVGTAPSKKAAREWAIAQGLSPKNMAHAWESDDLQGRTLAQWSADARSVVKSVGGDPAKPEGTDGTPEKQGDVEVRDYDDDGKITDTDRAIAAAGDARGMSSDDLAAEAEGGLPADFLANGGKGLALLPYDASPEALEGWTVKDWNTSKQVPVRYYERDAVQEPNKWSSEKLVQMQAALYQLGLYGPNGRYTVGTWDLADQKAYTKLLMAANISGRTAREQLDEWHIRPPDLATVLGDQKGSVHLTNPADIRKSARDVSKNLLGKVDRSFVEAAPAAYQGEQLAAGEATLGGASVVTDEGSMVGSLEERLRREKPIEVDGHSFVNQYQNFIKLLGPVV